MDIKNINLKNPIIIGVAVSIVIFAVIVLVYYFMFFSPLKTTLTRKKSTLNMLKIKYNSYITEVRQYPMLVKREKYLEAKFQRLLIELPSRKDVPGLLMKVANDEKILHLNLVMFKPEKAIVKSFYEVLPFSLNISGDFFNVYKFFYKLATMKRIVDVHNVSISSKNASTSKISVSFKGTTFSFLGPAPVKKIKSSKKVIK